MGQPQESPRVPDSVIHELWQAWYFCFKRQYKTWDGKCDLGGKKGMKGVCGCVIRSLLWDFTSFQIQDFTRH